MNFYEYIIDEFKNSGFTSELLKELINSILIFCLLLIFIIFVIGLAFIISKVFRLKDEEMPYEKAFEKAVIIILMIIFFWTYPIMLMSSWIAKVLNKIYEKRRNTSNDEHADNN